MENKKKVEALRNKIREMNIKGLETISIHEEHLHYYHSSSEVHESTDVLPDNFLCHVLRPTVHSSWSSVVQEFINSIIHTENHVLKNLRTAYEKGVPNIYPEEGAIYRAYFLPFNKVRVVMIGQDPYHGKGQADGLAFSTKLKERPPSLNIIFRELKRDTGIDRVMNKKKKDLNPNDLTDWRNQGIMLLNTVLTVQDKKPGSHDHYGWQDLILNTLLNLILDSRPKVFVTWGRKAQAVFDSCMQGPISMSFWEKNKHLNLRAPHPASDAYSSDSKRPKFTGCGHFGKINRFLREHYNTEIKW